MIDDMEVIKRVIEKYGKTHQTVVAMEELSELIKELSKQIRNEGKKENLIEEVADVYIMLTQIKEMYGLELDEIDRVIQEKIYRLFDERL